MEFLFVLILSTQIDLEMTEFEVKDYNLSGEDCIERLIEESANILDDQWYSCELQEGLPTS